MPDLTASPGRAPASSNAGVIMAGNMSGSMQSNANAVAVANNRCKEPMLLQGDFRKVSGISSEIFRQIEQVENDHDPSTAAALEVRIF